MTRRASIDFWREVDARAETRCNSRCSNEEIANAAKRGAGQIKVDRVGEQLVDEAGDDKAMFRGRVNPGVRVVEAGSACEMVAALAGWFLRSGMVPPLGG